MSDYRCPWCGIEIDDPDYWRKEPGEGYTVECGDCEREFTVRYYYDLVFRVTMPEELGRCSECRAWNGAEECCGWTDRDDIKDRNRVRSILGLGSIHPIEDCPLDYDKEKS